MKKVKITEIFSSIQGEGPYAGVKQIFVRFFGCHMNCVWCDTHFKNNQPKEYSIKEVTKKIEALNKNCHSVSLTGGEPLLHKDFIKELAPVIRKMKLKVYLETNGILYKELKEIISNIDIVAMDFKLPSSTKERSYWKEHKKFLTIARRKEVFVKAVITKDTTQKDIHKTIKVMNAIDSGILFILQPNFKDKELAVKKCLEFEMICSKKLSNVRIIPQVHKFLKVQ